MKFEEITKRLTGVSCPIFGVQWNPPEAHCTVAHRVVRFLEDRRVLYVPYDVEIQEYCSRSVIEIRAKLTDELGKLDQGSELFNNVKALRAACRKFLERTQFPGEPRRRLHDRFDHFDVEAQTFFTALGELRGTFGIHLARIAVQHGLDVEDELASIFPASDDEGDWK